MNRFKNSEVLAKEYALGVRNTQAVVRLFQFHYPYRLVIQCDFRFRITYISLKL
jgi:hypothetical protein